METNPSVLEKVRKSRQSEPCVSIYLDKTHDPLSEETASIALYRELFYARQLLERSLSRDEAAEYVKPLLRAAKDELMSDKPGTLALFKSGDATLSLHLEEPARSGTVVAETFHVKPLVSQARKAQSASLERALILCRRAMEEGRAVTGLFDVAQALKTGKAQCLWVAEDVTLWGLLNRERGNIVLHPRQMNERDGDVLDDLIEWAMDLGVDVQVLPLHQIPGQHPVIAEVQ